MKKQTKLYILMMIWVAAIVQFGINEAIRTDVKIIEAFSASDSMPLESNIDIWGSYGTMYLKQENKDRLLKNLAYELGITDEYDLDTTIEDGVTRTKLFKDGKNAKTILELVSLEKTEEDGTEEVEHYLIMNLTLYENVKSLLTYKEKLEGLFDEIGIKSKSSMCLNGSFNGKLSLEEKDKVTKNIFDEMLVKEIESKKTEEIYTVYGYTTLIKDYVVKSSEKINVNVAFSYDEEKDCTLLYIAVPFIGMDY